jgi:urease accessory protein
MNSRTRLLTTVTVIITALAPAMALAHPGHGGAENFVAGVLHPLSGLDHVLMIVAVSAWAGAMPYGGRLLIAASLALFVALGALVPVAPLSGLALESSIALTVVGSGILLAMGRRWPTGTAAMLAALFALIHGFAHGAEGPADSQAFVPGLAAATGALALGVSFVAARWQAQCGWLRAAGALGAAFGAVTLLA